MRARRWWLAILVLLAAMAWQSQRALESGKPPTVTPSTASDGPEVAASALDSTALPPTAASAEPADGAATAKPLAVSQSPAAPTLPTPTPAQAREWMRQRQRDMECGTARRDIASEIRETREWPWMPPERVAAERAAIAEARERLLQGCPPEIADEAERKRHWAQRQAELEAARRAGDLLARLSPVSNKTPKERNRARATLYDALLSGDPEAIAQIGRLQDYIQPAQIFDANPQAPASYVWPLVACDLGMDCGPGSRALDLACLSYGGGCGYAHLSDSYRDWLPPWQVRLVERRRAELLARIRSGQIAGIFDPPPRTQPGGQAMSRAARLRIAGAGLLALIAVGVWWIWVPDSPGPVPTSAASAADRAEPMSQASATDPTVRPDNLDPTARDPNTDAAAQVEARVAATEATKSATTTHGYRATPEQRTADLAAYLAAENLVALRAAWQARAAQGDADAARSLQQLYDECMGVLFGQNGLPRADRHNANGWPGWLPPDAPARIAALEIGRQRCRGILLELKYEDALRAIARLHREAAALATELGHPDNYLGIPRDRADWPAWGRTRMADLLADGHADAAFAIANSMAGIVARHSEIAWTLAACELGYPCSSTTPFMRYWCVEFGQHCDGAGLIDYYRSGLSPRDWRRALAERNEILRLLRAGDFEALMLPPGQMRGGGG